MSELHTVWHIGSQSFEYPPSVVEANDAMNLQGYRDVMSRLPIIDRHKYGGIDTIVLGNEGSSTEEAAVLYYAFANGLSDHNLIKAEHMRRTLVNAHITDQEGKELPVVGFASPSLGSTIKGISHDNLRIIKSGGIYPATTASMEALKKLNFGKVSLFGHSQAGSFAIHAATVAYHHGLDISAVAPSDMLGTKEFGNSELIKVFAEDAHNLETEVINAGLIPYIDAFGYGEKSSWLKRRRQDARFLIDVFSHPRLSSALYTALTKPTFQDAINNAALLYRAAFTAGYGNQSGIVDPVGLETQLEVARHAVWPTPDIQSVEIDGGRHTWSDNVPLYSSFALHAIQRAKAA